MFITCEPSGLMLGEMGNDGSRPARRVPVAPTATTMRHRRAVLRCFTEHAKAQVIFASRAVLSVRPLVWARAIPASAEESYHACRHRSILQVALESEKSTASPALPPQNRALRACPSAAQTARNADQGCGRGEKGKKYSLAQVLYRT